MPAARKTAAFSAAKLPLCPAMKARSRRGIAFNACRLRAPAGESRSTRAGSESLPGRRVQRDLGASLVAKVAFNAYPRQDPPESGCRNGDLWAVLTYRDAGLSCRFGTICPKSRGFQGFKGGVRARAHTLQPQLGSRRLLCARSHNNPENPGSSVLRQRFVVMRLSAMDAKPFARFDRRAGRPCTTCTSDCLITHGNTPPRVSAMSSGALDTCAVSPARNGVPTPGTQLRGCSATSCRRCSPTG